MTATRKRKNKKMRGTNSHGYGAKKKHRGAGSRGGRGMAGTGKRADVKKPSINPKTYFGKTGFTSKTPGERIIPITIATVIDKLYTWTKDGKVQEKNGMFQVNLTELGYNKLLAKGKVTKRLNINVSYATAGSIVRVKAAGGEVKGLLTEKVPVSASPEAEVKGAPDDPDGSSSPKSPKGSGQAG